jgi:hypothetical protein
MDHALPVQNLGGEKLLKFYSSKRFSTVSPSVPMNRLIQPSKQPHPMIG